MATLSAATLAAIAEAVAAALASAPVASSAPVEPSAASAHFKARDITCPARKPCAKTFRTAKGAAWHAANVDHATKA